MTNTDTMPFDPDQFMTSTVDAPMETEFQLVPEGSYVAYIDDFTSAAFERHSFTYHKGPKAGQEGQMTKFNIPFVINDEAVKTSLGRDKVVASMQLIVDVDSAGRLDFGKDKNIALGRVRKAVNQNDPGTWNPSLLKGAGPVVVQVKHETFKRRDGSPGHAARVVHVAKHGG